MKPKIPRRTGKSMEFKVLISESTSAEFILDFNALIYYYIIYLLLLIIYKKIIHSHFYL